MFHILPGMIIILFVKHNLPTFQAEIMTGTAGKWDIKILIDIGILVETEK
jgi:hypothetical protein